jgi:hypothetical protein
MGFTSDNLRRFSPEEIDGSIQFDLGLVFAMMDLNRAPAGVLPMPADPLRRELWKQAGTLSLNRLQELGLAIRKQLQDWRQERSILPAPARAIEHPKPQPDDTGMIDQNAPQVSNLALELERRLTQKITTIRGIRYFPLALAAALAQAPETTIRDWIKNKKKFGGKLIKTRASSAGLSVSQDSIDRMARRFIKWPSQEPAGAVTIGRTEDLSGYMGFTDAARELGIERHTIWRWATKKTGFIDRTLNVIKDLASDQFYIGEKDVAELRAHVPRSGLRRGPRPQNRFDL